MADLNRADRLHRVADETHLSRRRTHDGGRAAAETKRVQHEQDEVIDDSSGAGPAWECFMLGVLWAAKSVRPRFIQMFGAAQLLSFDGPCAKSHKNFTLSLFFPCMNSKTG